MWYYVRNSQRLGPVEDGEIRSLIANGTIVRQTMVWREGMQDWAQAATTELTEGFADAPWIPPAQPVTATYVTGGAAYAPESFRKLWLWFAWLVGAGLPLCFLFIGLPAVIAGSVIGYILLYRYWHIIQDGKARTSPGKAVGFLFIPFFNLYWFFVAVVGLAKDMNLYCDERNIAAPRINEGLAIAWFVLSLVGVIPYVGIVMALASVVIWILLFKQFSEAAAKIMERKVAA